MTAKLTRDRVAAILRDYAAGDPMRSIARRHRCSESTVCKLGRADSKAFAARIQSAQETGARLPWGYSRSRSGADDLPPVPHWVPAALVETYRNISDARDEHEAAARVRELKRRGVQ